MKFTITVKNPDSIEDSIDRAAEESIEDADFKDRHDYLDIKEEKKQQLWAACSKWVEYQEYIRIEIDTELGTAKVCEV